MQETGVLGIKKTELIMSSEKEQIEKARLHPRNKNRERYDLESLTTAIPELKAYVKENKHGVITVDFSNPVGVKLLNKALLHHYYGIENWDFPEENLCPAIPGRADYLHHIADLLSENNRGKIPLGDRVTCLDVGIGASCIYPILGVTEYGWNFIGADIDPKSIASSQEIVYSNASVLNKIEFRLQENSKHIFQGIIGDGEKIDVTMCNPPFHSSLEDAQKVTHRKVKSLTDKNEKAEEVNMAGNHNELIYDGGEYQFIKHMVKESKRFSRNCYWFSTLVSKESNLQGIYKLLKRAEAVEVKTISIVTGNKTSRIVAWTFLSILGQKRWRETRWKRQRVVNHS